MARELSDLSSLEKEGTVQRFEVATELAWKTLKDFLEYQGQLIAPVTPRNVIKAAFAAGIIADGQIWIDILGMRNALAHTYSEAALTQAMISIDQRFMVAFEELLSWFLKQKD